MPEAEWSEIAGYAGYLVSDEGQVRNSAGRVLKQRDQDGGKRVDLGKSGRMVHDLVARAFYGKPPPGYRVIHLNGNRKDNRLENLAYDDSNERCDNGHSLSRENVVIVDGNRGCLLCWVEVLDVGSQRWQDYYLGRTYPEMFA